MKFRTFCKVQSQKMTILPFIASGELKCDDWVEMSRRWVKIWGVYRCPSLLLSRLVAELSGKEKHTKFGLYKKNAPVRRIWLGMRDISLSEDGRYEMENEEERFALWRVKFRFLPLTWMGQKYLVRFEPLTWWANEIPHQNEAQVCTLNLIGRKMKYLSLILIGRKMKYLIEWGSGLYP